MNNTSTSTRLSREDRYRPLSNEVTRPRDRTQETAQRLSLIELKTFCSKHLPLYMIPDLFVFHEALPRTSTDKVDYQALKGLG